ncbi:Uncharacterised protein [uncultured Clostridium sp.]|uniref:helix-turn-helix domain-containing protein n=1 Tax=uncultured Clostridium sp. TaxID=59620 RepID=UPI00082093C5|nr:helix-turn-helix domain-containing protein [uncultured Clostridium sp.]SCJ37538.1 Uncharacterised protein [uncultured Clostridium sp.]
MSNSGFTIIDNNILRDSNLNMYEKYLLIILKSFDHKRSGEVYPTYEKLIQLSGITRRNNIAKIIKSLQEKNYIAISKKGRLNTYTFIKSYLLEGFKITTEEIINNKNIDINKNKTSNSVVTSKTNISNNGDTNKNDTSNSIVTNKKMISNTGDTITSNSIDTGNSNNVDTLKIKDKNTKEIYINIFNTWNDIDIYNEDKLTMQIVNSITIALRKHTKEEIITAMKNYKEIYYSDFYYDYTWSLQTFLTRQNALKKFTEDGELWTSYKSTKNKPTKEKFNLSDLID